MIRSTIFALAAAVAAIAGAATAQPAAQAQPQQAITAAVLVERMQPHLPRPFSGGSVLTGARAEGNMLIMTVEVPAAWPPSGRDSFVRGFVTGICGQPQNPFFDNRISVRIDITSAGSDAVQQGEVISRCPER